MMLSNQTSRVYCDEYDLQGVLNMLARRIDDPARTRDQTLVDVGAHLAINLIKNHRMDTQADFFALYDGLCEQGLGMGGKRTNGGTE